MMPDRVPKTTATMAFPLKNRIWSGGVGIIYFLAHLHWHHAGLRQKRDSMSRHLKHDAPKEILRRLRKLEEEIANDLSELDGMLQ
jgi:hypothetical protein